MPSLDCTKGQKPRMNPIHRDADRSAGLHLFQELSTSGQQLAHTLLFRQGLGGVKPMFPASTPRPLQTFGGSWSGTGAAVHTASSIGHCRRFGFPPDWCFSAAPLRWANGLSHRGSLEYRIRGKAES